MKDIHDFPTSFLAHLERARKEKDRRLIKAFEMEDDGTFKKFSYEERHYTRFILARVSISLFYVRVRRRKSFVAHRPAGCNLFSFEYIYIYAFVSFPLFHSVAVSVYLRVCASVKHVRCFFTLLLFGHFLV